MIKDFEVRYAKLLQEASKGPNAILPSAEDRGGYPCQGLPVVTDKRDIKCAEGGFIEQYCL